MNIIFDLISISGIFGSKGEKLDILPPPPPFPKLGQKAKNAGYTKKMPASARKEEEKARKLEEKKRKADEARQRKENELKEKKRQELEEQKKREKKEKIFKILHGVGLVKTEKEKKELQRKKEEEKRVKELEKRRIEQGRKKIEQERIACKQDRQKAIMLKSRMAQQENQRQMELQEKISKKEEKTQQEPRRRKLREGANKEAEGAGIIDIKPERRKMSIKEHFAGLFPRIIFAKKEKRAEMSEEIPLPNKREKAQRSTTKEVEMPELMPREAEEKKCAVKEPDFLLKKEEEMPSIAKDEEEIQKAIESLRQPKRQPLLGRIFAKKVKMPEAQRRETGESPESKVEMPHVMPKTYNKIDHVEIVEAKIHKARMALMEFNFEEAKEVYIEIMKDYNSMEPKEKQEVYEDIKDLYYERKSSERFANK